MINKAIKFATDSHAGQSRKGTEIPYILHCLEAGVIASNVSLHDGRVDADVVSAAILHDTIEDADVSFETLVSEFNENIANLVQSQSEDKSKGWLERKQHTIDFLQQNPSKDVEMATLADKLSNMRSIHRDYKEQGETFWEKFNADKESQHWYYHSIAQAFIQVVNTDEYNEYTKLISETFE